MEESWRKMKMKKLMSLILSGMLLLIFMSGCRHDVDPAVSPVDGGSSGASNLVGTWYNTDMDYFKGTIEFKTDGTGYIENLTDEGPAITPIVRYSVSGDVLTITCDGADIEETILIFNLKWIDNNNICLESVAGASPDILCGNYQMEASGTTLPRRTT
jgi:hypothetical protein